MTAGLPAGRIFAVLALGQVVVSVDAGVITIALPSIQRDFPLGMTQVWWILMAYLIAAASSAMVMGEVGDRIGRRRVYLVGQGLFAIGCVIAMLAPSINVVVVARAVQGVGAGAVTALALAMLTQSVSTDQIPRLEGRWMSLSAAAAAMGPLIGGAAVTWLGWRWVFGAESLVMLCAIVLVLFAVPSGFGQSDERGRVDVMGTALLSVALVAFVGGLGMIDDHRFDAVEVWGPMALGLVVAGGLVFQQRRTTNPLADWSMMRRPPIPAALGILGVKVLVMTGALLQLALLIQGVLGFTPFVAGLTAFAMSATVVGFSPLSGRLIAFVGLRLTVILGLTIIAVAFFGLSGIGPTTTALQIAAWMAMMGVGVGFADPSLNAAALEAVPKAALGAFSGFLGLVLSMAGALGIALVGAYAATVVTNDWLAASTRVTSAVDWTDRVVAGELAAVNAGTDPATAAIAATSFAHGATASLLFAGFVIVGCAVAVIPLLSPRAGVVTPAPAEATSGIGRDG